MGNRDFLFCLLSDALLYASQSAFGDKLVLHRLLPFDHQFCAKRSAKLRIRHMFEIHSSKESFMVYGQNKMESDEWLRSIQKAHGEHVNSAVFAEQAKQQSMRRMHEVHAKTLYVPNDFADECMVSGCKNKFNFVSRRHHCKYCGLLCCGKCVSNELPARRGYSVISRDDAAKKQRMVKVCKVCFRVNAPWNEENATSRYGLQVPNPNSSPNSSAMGSVPKKPTRAQTGLSDKDGVYAEMAELKSVNRALKEKVATLERHAMSLEEKLSEKENEIRRLLLLQLERDEQSCAVNGGGMGMGGGLPVPEYSAEPPSPHLMAMPPPPNAVGVADDAKADDLYPEENDSYEKDESLPSSADMKRLCVACGMEIVGRAMQTNEGLRHKKCMENEID